MTTKITLAIDDEVIRTARRYAKQQGRSLSKLIEDYLRTLSGCDDPEQDFSPVVKRLMGAVKLSDDYDYKAAVQSAVSEKYIR